MTIEFFSDRELGKVQLNSEEILKMFSMELLPYMKNTNSIFQRIFQNFAQIVLEQYVDLVI